MAHACHSCQNYKTFFGTLTSDVLTLGAVGTVAGPARKAHALG